MMTLRQDSIEAWSDRLSRVTLRVAAAYPGERPDRQPIHTVYGGAHLFSADTSHRLGELALGFMERWMGDPGRLEALFDLPAPVAAKVHTLVREKLATEPVEDFRIDFEDGYGNRPDAEEDGHAIAAATQLAEGMRQQSLPPFTGIRVKSLAGDLFKRSLRTLDLFITTAVEQGGALPPGFAVTLPKIQDVEQVTVLAEALDQLEQSTGIGPVAIELMAETPQTVIDLDRTTGARKFVLAGGDRVRGVHFGTYDYTASMSITAAHQTMTHPACGFALHMLQTSLAGTGVWISDGATNVMPVPIHRGDDLTDTQLAENREVIEQVMQLHYYNVRHSLLNAYYQGWDLHPAQLPTRYAATYAFFLEGLEGAGQRLTHFVDSAAKATLVGEVFDDAATGQGLLNFFLRAINCGAITEDEAVERSGLSVDEIRSRSFAAIMAGRSSG